MESYSDAFRSKYRIIGISGIIGAGKSTFARAIAKRLGWSYIGEPVSENPYLADFYIDKAKYGFAMQIFLLHHRFRQHQEMVWSSNGAVQDRTIYEDVIFAKMLHESGDITKRDFETYCSAFDVMSNFIHRPDLIIYLDVTPETALERVKGRGRECEQGMPIEYLRALRAGYEDWLETGIRGRIPVLRVNWNNSIDLDEMLKKIDTMIAEHAGTFIV